MTAKEVLEMFATPLSPEQLKDLEEQKAELKRKFYQVRAHAKRTNDPIAQAVLAQYYINGLALKSINEKRGLEWLRRAAEQGHTLSQFWVAWYLTRCDDYLDKDGEEIVMWLKRAADNRLAPAQYMLGRYYCLGKGVEKDEELGLMWKERAFKRAPRKMQEFDEYYSAGALFEVFAFLVRKYHLPRYRDLKLNAQ